MKLVHRLKFSVPCSLGLLLLAAGCSRNVTSVELTDAATTPPTTTVAEKSSAQKILWQPSLEKAIASAKSQGKPVMIDFYATWCAPCKLLDQQIYPTSGVVQEAKNFVTVRLDVDMHSEAARKYNVGGLPTLVFLDTAGNEFYRMVGLSEVGGEAGEFAKLLRKIHNDLPSHAAKAS